MSRSTTGRPALVTAAAVAMMIIGVLLTLLGAVLFVGAAFFGGAASEAPGLLASLAGAFSAAFIAASIILLAIGVLEVVAGAHVLSGRPWARIAGVTLAGATALLSILGIGDGDARSILVRLLWIAANLFIAAALVIGRRWFADSRAPGHA